MLNGVTKYLNPDYLINGVAILAFSFFLIVAIIYYTLYIKKRRFVFTNKIQQELEIWVTQAILDENVEGSKYNIPKKFLTNLKTSLAKQFVIDELIKTKKNLTGTASKNIIALYLELGLKKSSLKKIETSKWSIKAKGIHELYSMEQFDCFELIYKLTNSNNEFVRMEAQIGVINLTGFDGLRFLDDISFPLTGWQQIKLLDQLKSSDDREELSSKIPHWLISKNDTVIILALKLADEYQQFLVHDKVVKCLQHKNDLVRNQTIKTLIRIANETTSHILVEQYARENNINQLAILDALNKTATVDQAWFLINLLDDESDAVKLKAGRCLANCFPQGLEALEERGRAPQGPYQQIYLHIKSEMER